VTIPTAFKNSAASKGRHFQRRRENFQIKNFTAIKRKQERKNDCVLQPNFSLSAKVAIFRCYDTEQRARQNQGDAHGG